MNNTCENCKKRFECLTTGKGERCGCPVEYMVICSGEKLNTYGQTIYKRDGSGTYAWGWEKVPCTSTYRTVGAAKKLRTTLMGTGDYQEGELKIAKLEVLPV